MTYISAPSIAQKKQTKRKRKKQEGIFQIENDYNCSSRLPSGSFIADTTQLPGTRARVLS